MTIYSIGFTQKSAAEFFGLLKKAGIRRLVGARLNSSSQLAGFSKSTNLPFFLRELCHAEYVHQPLLAPTQEILDAYRKSKGDWKAWERDFNALIRRRQIAKKLDRAQFATPTVLLCSEATPEHCHRRLVLEYLAKEWDDVEIVHL